MKDKIIDLHTHTTYSDGDLTPIELINLAIKNNIKTISITDHDTLRGIQSIDYKAFNGINIIPGIELSAKVDKGIMHILGYGIDIDNKELNDKIINLRANSLYSVLSIITQIKNDYNIFFSYEEIQNLINFNGNLGRPNIARLLIKNRYATSVQDAFDKYLIESYKKTRKSNKGISYIECIKLILNSGGTPVLAHPKTLELTDKELLFLLKDMISYGLKGIEAFHSDHSIEETNKYLKLANDLGLFVSGGSDFHGPITKPNINLGTGKNNNLKIKKLSILNELKKININ